MQIMEIKNHDQNEIQIGDKLTDMLMHGILYTVERGADGSLGVYDRFKFINLSAFLSAYKPVYILRKDI